MKFLILSDSKASFVYHQTNSLKKMLEKIGNNVDINTLGLKSIGYTPTRFDQFRHTKPCNSVIKEICKFIFSTSVRKSIENADCIIVVASVPGIFLNSKLFIEDILRKEFPNKPVVAFITEHLLTMGHWYEALSTGSNMLEHLGAQRHHLLERFDWYLCVSQSGLRRKPVGEIPLTQVGIDFDDGSLYPEQGDNFTALIDFKRSRYIQHLDIQLEALKKTNINYTMLEGRYSISDIRAIYRKSAVYFIAHLESFGFPIAELQACGSYVATPYDFWCCGHYRDLIYDNEMLDHLTDNFLVYNADLDTLCDMLMMAKETYDPERVRENFLENFNLFYSGDLDALSDFVKKLENKSINSNSHLEYKEIKPEPMHIKVYDKFGLI